MQRRKFCVSTNSISSCSMSCASGWFSSVSLQKQSTALATAWVVRRFLWENAKLNATHSCQWKPCLATKVVLGRFCLSNYQETLLASPSYILGSFFYIRFPYHPSKPPNFQKSFLHSLSQHYLHSCSPPDPSVSVPSHPQSSCCIYSISLSQGDPYLYLFPSFSKSTVCRFVIIYLMFNIQL